MIRIDPRCRRLSPARCRLRERKPEEAFRDFDKAVELAPNDASTRLDRGLSYVLHRELEKAAPDLRVAIKLGIDAADPKFRQAEASPVQVLNELVEMRHRCPRHTTFVQPRLKRQRRWTAPWRTSTRPCGSIPILARRTKGRLLLGSGKPKEAVSEFSQAVRWTPQCQAAYVGRAQVYERLGKRGEAQADRESALRLSPKQNVPR